MGARRSGRTTRMMQAAIKSDSPSVIIFTPQRNSFWHEFIRVLSDEGIYIDDSMFTYIREQDRDKEYRLMEDPEMLICRSGEIFIDHFWIEVNMPTTNLHTLLSYCTKIENNPNEPVRLFK